MKYELKTYTVQTLAKAYEDKPSRLPINREYQRGPRWKPDQNRALIDSLLRGYRLPLFYVHLVERPDEFTPDRVVTTRYLVDGQQRLEAIKLYRQNAFALADLHSEKPGAVVARLVQGPAGWDGKRWNELTKEDQQRFLDQPLLVMEMREETDNEVRELFIRLQSGTPLTPQEKRDAWPGDFTEFVTRYAGKPDTDVGETPHRFFDLFPVRRGPRRAVFGEDEEENYVDGRADMRKFFAGLAMTIMRRKRDAVLYLDLKGKTIDSFYLANLRLRPDDPAAKRVLATLDCVASLPRFGALVSGPKFKFNMAFHLALLVDTLNSGDYTNAWKTDLVTAFQAFQEKVAQARLGGEETGGSLHPYWLFAKRLSGGGSDTSLEIRRRHAFFSEQMYHKMRVASVDPNRNFGPLEREVIWNRDGRRCQNPDCNNYQETDGEVPFSEATVHHVVEHCAAGATRLENGVLVCRVCHRDRDLMLRLEPRFHEYLRRIYRSTGEEATRGGRETNPPADAQADNAILGEIEHRRGRRRRGERRLKIEIHWRRLGVDLPDQIIEGQPNDSVVTFLTGLLKAKAPFGDSMRRQLTQVRVIRYPLSSRRGAFVNQANGRPYSSLAIADTGLFLSPISGNEEKVKRLRSCVEALTLPNGSPFPQGSVEFSIVEDPTA